MTRPNPVIIVVGEGANQPWMDFDEKLTREQPRFSNDTIRDMASTPGVDRYNFANVEAFREYAEKLCVASGPAYRGVVSVGDRAAWIPLFRGRAHGP